MAENKKSFVLYSDLIHTVRKMPKEKAGELFMVILEYVNDENPTVNDLLVDLVFEPVKQSLKRDLNKYEDKKEIRSNAGQIANLKRWNLDLYERFVNKEITLEKALDLVKNRKTSDSDKNVPKIPVSVNDNVSVNVSVNDILLEKETKEESEKILEIPLSRNETFGKELLEGQTWIETISMQNKIKPPEVETWIETFNKKLLTELDNKISKKDYAAHFSRWLPTEIQKLNKHGPGVVPPVARTKNDYF